MFIIQDEMIQATRRFDAAGRPKTVEIAQETALKLRATGRDNAAPKHRFGWNSMVSKLERLLKSPVALPAR